jgi:hypothetical protein
MKRYVIIGLLSAGLATPAFAAQESEAEHYVVVDTVGICSVINSEPSAGLKVIGNEDGYEREEAAQEFLMEEAKGSDQCKDIIQPV